MLRYGAIFKEYVGKFCRHFIIALKPFESLATDSEHFCHVKPSCDPKEKMSLIDD